MMHHSNQEYAGIYHNLAVQGICVGCWYHPEGMTCADIYMSVVRMSMMSTTEFKTENML